MPTKVAIAGATGNLGSKILIALLEAGFDVTILSRKDSSSTDSLPSHPRQKVTKVDYSDKSDLEAALAGIEVVVSNLASQALDAQKPLIDASISAGVQRYLPSEFGSDLDVPKVQVLPVYTGKIETRKYLEKAVAANPSFSYTYFANNAFFDWGLQVGFLPANVKTHHVTLYDGGDVKFSLTTLASVGKGVVGVINNLEATKNRYVRIHDTALTLNQIVAVTKSIDGKEWTSEVKDTKDVLQASYEELGKPQPDFGKAMYGFLFVAAFSAEGKPDYTDRLDNDLLGVKQFTDKQVKDLIKSILV